MRGLGLLEEAQETVRERQAQYGPPTDHHVSTAAVWTILLRGKLRPGEVIHASDVGLLYAADKLVRESFQPKRDNRLDVVGYMVCREETIAATVGDDELGQGSIRR